MGIQQVIAEALSKSLENLGVNTRAFTVEPTADFNHGDFTSNAPLVYAKELGLNPRALAEKIVDNLRGIEGVSKVDIAGPGFINFSLSEENIRSTIKEILRDIDSFGSTELHKGKEVLVEYTQPNPLKVFHIGHLMSNTIGESITRLFESAGATVRRLNYQGDVGLHVAKALWGMKKYISELPGEDATLRDKTAFLGRVYVEGAQAYEEDETAKEEIKEINKKIYEKDPEILELYEKGKKWSLDHFEEIYLILGTRFDRYYFESETTVPGLRAVKENLGSVFTESDGATVYPGEADGLHTRVFITSQGLPTYEAKDLGLNLLKDNEYPRANLSIVVTAEEQKEYMKVVKAALSKIAPQFADKFLHITHGMMQLSTGKMSSRKGNVISGEGIIFEVLERIEELMKEREIEESLKAAIARSISVAAVKYPILKQSLGKNIAFDMDSSISFEGDSGPYLQYSRVRALSVLEKGKREGLEPNVGDTESNKLSNLERTLIRFTYILKRAQEEIEPHHVSTYLMQLSREWNAYYGSTKILGGEGVGYRLALAEAVSLVLKRGLWILGIEAPERM